MLLGLDCKRAESVSGVVSVSLLLDLFCIEDRWPLHSRLTKYDGKVGNNERFGPVASSSFDR